MNKKHSWQHEWLLLHNVAQGMPILLTAVYQCRRKKHERKKYSIREKYCWKLIYCHLFGSYSISSTTTHSTHLLTILVSCIFSFFFCMIQTHLERVHFRNRLPEKFDFRNEHIVSSYAFLLFHFKFFCFISLGLAMKKIFVREWTCVFGK